MTHESLFLFDSTRHDGQQAQGLQFSTAEKFQTAATLVALGVDYTEVDLPWSNPNDSDLFADAPFDPRQDNRVRDYQSGRPVEDFNPAKLEALQ